MAEGGAADRFWSELQNLYQAAGRPTLSTLVRLGSQQRPPIEISDSTINGWLNRKAIPQGSKNERYLIAMVAFLQTKAGRQGKYQPSPEGTWTELLREAKKERAERKRNSRLRRSAEPPYTSYPSGMIASGNRLSGHITSGSSSSFPRDDTFGIHPAVAYSGPAVRSGYLEQVRRLAPPELQGRENELAQLTAFCSEPGRGRYMWWRAAPWTGKSALLSWFVLRPPPGVQIVSFFVTARFAGQNDRVAFADVMLEQLAALLKQPLPPYLTEATREPHLLRMLADAVDECQQRGRNLVLVVDGLDEDRGVTSGPDAYSIAALLPARPATGLRIIIACPP